MDDASRPPQRDGFVAVLLAGGRSRRMGQDKAMLDLEGRPLWRHQLETLLSLRPAHTLISTRPGQKLDLDPEGLPPGTGIVADEKEGGGALPALIHLLSNPLPNLPRLVVAVDMPRINSPFLKRTFFPNDPTNPGTVLQGITLVDPEGALQPVPCLLTPACLGPAEELVAQGEFSLRAYCRLCHKLGLVRQRTIAPEDASRLVNLNSPEDWQLFTKSR